MKLIFATHNAHKAEEIRLLTKDRFEIRTLDESGIHDEIPEPFDSLEENAAEKSKTIYNMTGENCFSEDTGLEVHALGGEPGVKSARYSGENRSFEDNMTKLLGKMENIDDRSARFRTVISLILGGEETRFEGICNGIITTERRGNGGFGYDPVFIPEGSAKTFAEMSPEEKAVYSHRARATAKLVEFLNNLKIKS